MSLLIELIFLVLTVVVVFDVIFMTNRLMDESVENIHRWMCTKAAFEVMVPEQLNPSCHGQIITDANESGYPYSSESTSKYELHWNALILWHRLQPSIRQATKQFEQATEELKASKQIYELHEELTNQLNILTKEIEAAILKQAQDREMQEDKSNPCVITFDDGTTVQATPDGENTCTLKTDHGDITYSFKPPVYEYTRTEIGRIPGAGPCQKYEYIDAPKHDLPVYEMTIANDDKDNHVQ